MQYSSIVNYALILDTNKTGIISIFMTYNNIIKAKHISNECNHLNGKYFCRKHTVFLDVKPSRLVVGCMPKLRKHTLPPPLR
jgi:hypothetical protein